MDPALARSIVGSLSSSPLIAAESIDRLSRFRERRWASTLRWLENSGLTLYLLRRLDESGRAEVVPPAILSGLRQNQRGNRERVRQMLDEFSRINQAFEREGLHYVVMKGLALVPEFCPDISLRAQSDLDYKVDAKSLESAKRVLTDLGYRLVKSSDTEFGFCAPGGMGTFADSAFAPSTKPMVELHLAVWDPPVTSVPFVEPVMSPLQAQAAEYMGVRFPALNLEDSFLLQIVHVFQHVLTCWIRISWLLELAYFLDHHRDDRAFWTGLDERLSQSPELREFAAIVTGLTSRTFDVVIPAEVQTWQDHLRPAARAWLENFADPWLLSDHPVHERSWFPPSKLVLFLHGEYLADANVRKRVKLDRIFPRKRPQPIAESTAGFSAAEVSRQRLASWVQRIAFHVGSSLRYAWETPRWHWLKRGRPLRWSF